MVGRIYIAISADPKSVGVVVSSSPGARVLMTRNISPGSSESRFYLGTENRNAVDLLDEVGESKVAVGILVVGDFSS